MALPKINLLVPQDGYRFRDGDEVLRAKLGAGPSRFRLDMIGAPIEADISLVLNPTQYQYWRSFWRSTINRGSLPFLIDIVVESGSVAEYEARIIPGTHQLASVQGTAHFVQMAIEATATVADDAEFDAALVLLYETYGEDSALFLNMLAELVNVTLPENLS